MIVPMVVAFAFFIENFDSTVVTTALPSMAVSFQSTPVELSVAITAYILAVAIFIPISGWLADRFGARNVFGTAIALFTISSICCGLSLTLTQFTLARIFQGIAGAMMVPVGRLIVLRSVEKKNFVKAMAFVTIPSVLGQILGPPVGGFITTYFSWQWIFFMNIPIGIIGFVLVQFFIKNFKQLDTPPLDWIGFLLTGAAIGSLMYALELVVRPKTEGAVILTFLCIGVIVTVVAIWHARRHPAPMVDLSLLKVPTFNLVMIGGFTFRMSVGAASFLLPLQLQIGFGVSAFTSGLLTLFLATGAFMMKAIGPPILRRWGFRNVLIGNGILYGLSVLSYAFFTPSTPFLLISTLLFCGGLFRSLQFTSINTVCYADIPSVKMSSATSFSSTADRFAIGAGVSMSAILLHLSTGMNVAKPVDFQLVFLAFAVLAFISVQPYLRLKRDAGHELSGHAVSVVAQNKKDQS